MKILELIIDMYIKHGVPVSSKTISELFQNSISSATVRNEMARLYELGFLEQPHTSAGRIPSQLGYRLYVNQIMKKKPLSEYQTKQIESWFNVRDLDYTALIENSGKILSQITACMTILSSMAFKSLIITKIEIVEIANMTLAVILITSSGIIKSKVCKVDFDLDNNTIDYIYQFVNNTFSKKSVEEISKEYVSSVITNLNHYQNLFSPVFYNIYEMCRSLQISDFYIYGQTNLLLYNELKDTAVDIIKFLSNKNIVSSIINNKFYNNDNDNCNDDNSGLVNIKFGKELKQDELINVCLIVSRYNIGNIGTGNILIVGPGRINYSVLVPWIEYFSNMLSNILSESLEII